MPLPLAHHDLRIKLCQSASMRIALQAKHLDQGRLSQIRIRCPDHPFACAEARFYSTPSPLTLTSDPSLLAFLFVLIGAAKLTAPSQMLGFTLSKTRQKKCRRIQQTRKDDSNADGVLLLCLDALFEPSCSPRSVSIQFSSCETHAPSAHYPCSFHDGSCFGECGNGIAVGTIQDIRNIRSLNRRLFVGM